MKIINIDEAVKQLNKGNVVGIPTDTVYGLAATIDNIGKLYEIKHRDNNKKIIYLIDDINKIDNLKKEDIELISTYWPGNNSIIIDDQGYRIPKHQDVIELIKQLGKPIAVTSANISGQEVVKTQKEFSEVFVDIDLLKDNINNMSFKASNVYRYHKDSKEFEQLR